MKKKSVSKYFFALLVGWTCFSIVHGQDLNNDERPIELITKTDGYFLNFNESYLNRYVSIINLIVNRDSRGRRLYKGVEINSAVVRFVKGPTGQVRVYKRNEGRDGRAVVKDENEELIQELKFNQAAGDSTLLIDISSWIAQDSGFLSFAEIDAYGLSSAPFKKHWAKSSQPHGNGLDIRLIKEYVLSSKPSETVSVEINSSLLILPEVPMKARLTDDRVTANTWSTTVINLNNDEQIRFQHRFRMEPKEEDTSEYLKGNLVDPKKPIVFYIDPETPKKLIQYFKQAVEIWGTAFEKAGFRNAIQAKEVDTSDTTFNFFSSRYNKVIYYPVESPAATADYHIDPRSGEILTAFANIPDMAKYLRTEYLVQAGAVDTSARKAYLSDEQNGALQLPVIAHEVGHCLGIHHNYFASSTISVKELRNKLWVEKNAISPSIMDYTRNNYVAQPRDGITPIGLRKLGLGKLGAYDIWVIEWLYTWYSGSDAEADQRSLLLLTKKRLSQDKKVRYIPCEFMRNDVRVQMEDVGNDPVLASSLGFRNLQLIIPNILKWSQKEDGSENPELATETYEMAWKQYAYYIDHVQNLIGGTIISDIENFHSADSNRKQRSVPKRTQKKAIRFLFDNLFTEPTWLVKNDVVAELKINTGRNLGFLQRSILQHIFFPEWFGKSEVSYPFGKILNEFEKLIFNKGNFDQFDSVSKTLQLNYLVVITRFASASKFSHVEKSSIPKRQEAVRSHLKKLKCLFERMLAVGVDPETKRHLEKMVFSIDAFFQNGNHSETRNN